VDGPDVMAEPIKSSRMLADDLLPRRSPSMSANLPSKPTRRASGALILSTKVSPMAVTWRSIWTQTLFSSRWTLSRSLSARRFAISANMTGARYYITRSIGGCFTLIQRLVPTTAIRPIPSFDINPSSVGGVICAPFCGASATA
jgi:hypothetical protein